MFDLSERIPLTLDNFLGPIKSAEARENLQRAITARIKELMTGSVTTQSVDDDLAQLRLLVLEDQSRFIQQLNQRAAVLHPEQKSSDISLAAQYASPNQARQMIEVALQELGHTRDNLQMRIRHLATVAQRNN